MKEISVYFTKKEGTIHFRVQSNWLKPLLFIKIGQFNEVNYKGTKYERKGNYIPLYLYLYISTSISLPLYTYLYISTSISLPLYLYLYISTYISLPLYLYLYIPTSISLPLYLYLYISTYISLPLYLYLYIPTSISLPLYLYLYYLFFRLIFMLKVLRCVP